MSDGEEIVALYEAVGAAFALTAGDPYCEVLDAAPRAAAARLRELAEEAERNG